MRGTKAYIASAGTAAVMLGASLCTFALVSALVAFGSWPGASAHTNLDQVVLNSVQRPQAPNVTVSKDAVVIAKRAAAARRAASKTEPAGTRSPAGTPLATVPRTPSGASSQPQTSSAAGPSAPSGGSSGGNGAPVSAPSVPPSVKNTTDNVTTQVQNTTQNVQNQVDEVVNQVAGTTPVSTPPLPAPPGGASDVVNGATGAVGGIPPH